MKRLEVAAIAGGALASIAILNLHAAGRSREAYAMASAGIVIGAAWGIFRVIGTSAPSATTTTYKGLV